MKPVHCPAVNAPVFVGERETPPTLLVALTVTAFVNDVKIPFVASRAVIMTVKGTAEVCGLAIADSVKWSGAGPTESRMKRLVLPKPLERLANATLSK